MLRYLFYTKDESRQEKLIKIIEEMPVRGEEIAMTTAEKYIQKRESLKGKWKERSKRQKNFIKWDSRSNRFPKELD